MNEFFHSFRGTEGDLSLDFGRYYRLNFLTDLRFQDTSSLLKNSDCRLLKKVSEARRAKNRRAQAYSGSTLERGD
jgi:hypothetical protein